MRMRDSSRALGCGRFRAIALCSALFAFLLTGCVSIPTSGSVTAGRELGTDLEPELVFQPNGPAEGASPEEIITGFVQAAIGPQDSYEVARQFLAEEFSDEWDPNASVLIRSGEQAAIAVDDNSYEVTFSAVASVDETGLYTSLPSPQPSRVSFDLVQEDGEWRIGNTPDGIVLTEQYFDDIFDPYPLYYFAPGYAHLVPDLRWFPSISTTSTRLVRELLAGPSEWMAPPAVVTAFPEGTGVSLVDVEAGRAVVDLSGEARTERIAMQRMKLQLSSTLSSVPSIQGVDVRIDRTPTTIEDLGVDGPVVQPQVNGSPLVSVDGSFGFLSSGEVTPLSTLGEKVAALSPHAATLSSDESLAAVLNESGVWAVGEETEAILVDGRPGLVAPSLDSEGFLWSVPAADPSAILAISPTGEQIPIAAAWEEGDRIVSLNVSRDGVRLLVLLDSAQGPRMIVASIVRDDRGAPVRLTSPVLELAAEPGTPLDATWVDNVTVASLTRPEPGEDPVIVLQQVGGQSEELGDVAGAVSIVGGNGRSNLRVLTSDGTIQVPRGSGWQRAGAGVDFIATQR